MTADFQSALRNAEGSLSVARDNLALYEKLVKQWREEVNISVRVLERLREASGIPLDAPILRPAKKAEGVWDKPLKAEEPEPEPEPEQEPGRPTEAEEAAVTRPLPVAPAAAAGANGLDRAAIRRRFLEWHISYPLKKNYARATPVARQAYRAILIDHPDYYHKWLRTGHTPLTDSTKGITMPMLHECAELLGVEYEPIRREAFRLQRDVDCYGTPGLDYLWDPK
jgi:hypothetical protein